MESLDLVVVDLTGYPVSDEAGSPGLITMLEGLNPRYRLLAFIDSHESRLAWRDRLDAAGIGSFFERVASSADLPNGLSPRVLHELGDASASGVAVITTRSGLADEIRQAGYVAVLIDPLHPLAEIPQQLSWWMAVRSEGG